MNGPQNSPTGRAANLARKPKVNQAAFGRPVRQRIPEKHVLRLDVAVHPTLLVNKTERVEELPHNATALLQLSATHELGKRRSTKIVHRKEL